MTRRVPLFLAVTWATVALVWTGVGESSNPQLRVAELPIDIANACGADPHCAESQTMMTRWVGKTRHGHLFLVRRQSCYAPCAAWMVEQTPVGVLTRLTMDGEFRLSIQGRHYPDVEVRRGLSDVRVKVDHYRWTEGRYVRTASQDIYRVDGIECGSVEDCHRAALRAHHDERSDEALKIWDAVHGLSWI